MPCLTTSQWLPVELDRVFRFFADPRNLPRITPAASGARIVSMNLVPPAGVKDPEGLAGAGSEIVVSIRLFPFLPLRALWTARIVEFENGRFFRDVQSSGPFRKWDHRHEFAAEIRDAVVGTVVRDVLDYEVGYGPLGPIASALFIGPLMRRTFEHRHRETERLLTGNVAA